MNRNKKVFLETVASMYYVLNMSQQEIANQFNVGRSSVARYLNEAKEAGLIRFVITDSNEVHRFTSLENKLINKYHVKDVVVLNSDENQFFISAVSYLNSILPFKGLIGIGGGHTLRKFSNYIGLIDKRPNVDIVQLVGEFNIDPTILPTSSLMNIWAAQLQSNAYYLAAPAIASSLQNKESIQDNEVISQIYKKYEEIDLCLVGIGNVDKEASVIQSNTLTTADKKYIEDNCVGDINLHFFNEAGHFNSDTISNLNLGISRNNYLKIQNKVAISYGDKKIEAIHATLKNKLVNILITDSHTAEKLV